MIRNYFKTAWRNLWKNKFYSTINIAGLAIGLAVGIMILIWVQDEYSYDGFHKNAGDIYKVNSHLGKGSDESVWEGAPGPIAVFCKQSIPEVVNVVRIDNVNMKLQISYKENRFFGSGMAHVDSTFFSLFDFRLLQGDTKQPFPNMNSVVISASEAKKYFGNENALGKVLTTSGLGNFTVSGVMQDFPANSTLQFKILFPMALDADYFEKSGGNGNWKTIDEDLGSFSFQTYLQLQQGASPQTVAEKITKIFRDKKGSDAKNDFFALQPLTSRHLVAADGSTDAQQTVKMFLLVAVFILLIACINYINLSTARAVIRSKEVSVRKIIGAAKMQLFIQFIIESALVFLFAAVLAFLIIYLLLPLYNNISGKNLVFSLADRNVWLVVVSSITGTLALSAIYPAVQLSSFKPIQALKGRISFGMGNVFFRKILVVTQFVFSVALITATIIISQQLKYIREKDLGYNKENVFKVPLKEELQNHYDAVRAELLKQPGISGIATSGNSIVGSYSSTGDTYWEGKETGRTFLVQTNAIDQNFIPLLNLKLQAGSNFTGGKGDSASFILNETAVKEAGIKDPIGKSFTLWQTKGTIIGVVKDFNYASLKDPVKPSVFFYKPSNPVMYVKTSGKEAPGAIAAVQKIWQSYAAAYPFEYSFIEEDYNRLYQADQRTGALFNVFTVVAIFISCLGLFGLVTYTAQVKTKEIGIRKVLGASVTNITSLLAKEFVILVLIAFIIATPAAWLAMNKWLENYTYRISINWWIFIAAGAAAVLIAVLTVSFQSIKAAIANPVKSLRAE